MANFLRSWCYPEKKILHAFGLHLHHNKQKVYFHGWLFQTQVMFFWRCFFLKVGVCKYLFVLMWQNAQTLCILLNCLFVIFISMLLFCFSFFVLCPWLSSICKCSPHTCFLLIHTLRHANRFNKQLKTKRLRCCFNITYCNFIFNIFVFLSERCDVYGGNVLCVNLISTIHWHAGLTC